MHLSALSLPAYFAIAAASSRMTKIPAEEAKHATPSQSLRTLTSTDADVIALICAAMGAYSGEKRVREVMPDEVAFDCETKTVFDPMCASFYDDSLEYEECFDEVEFTTSIPLDGSGGDHIDVYFCVRFEEAAPDDMGKKKVCISLGLEVTMTAGTDAADEPIKLKSCAATIDGQDCGCTVCRKGCIFPILVGYGGQFTKSDLESECAIC